MGCNKYFQFIVVLLSVSFLNGNIMDNLFSPQGKHIPSIIFPEQFQIQLAQKFNIPGIGEVKYNVTIKYSGELRLFELEDHLVTTSLAAGNYSLTNLLFDMNNRKLWIKNMFSGCKNFTTNKWINLVFDNLNSLWQLGTLYKGITEKGTEHIFNINPIFESLPGSEKLQKQLKESVGVQAFFDKHTEKLNRMKVKIGNATLSFLTEGLKEMNFTQDNFSDPSKWDCSGPQKNVSGPITKMLELFGNSSIGQMKSYFESMSQLFVGQSIDTLTNMLVSQGVDFDTKPQTLKNGKKPPIKTKEQLKKEKDSQWNKGNMKGSVLKQKVEQFKKLKTPSDNEGHNPYEM